MIINESNVKTFDAHKIWGRKKKEKNDFTG